MSMNELTLKIFVFLNIVMFKLNTIIYAVWMLLHFPLDNNNLQKTVTRWKIEKIFTIMHYNNNFTYLKKKSIMMCNT